MELLPSAGSRHVQGEMALRAGLVGSVRTVQAMPYAWPGPWDAVATRAAGRGTCAGKHAVLAEELERLGLVTSPLLVVGALVPEVWPDLLVHGQDLIEVHECLTVETPWAGPLIVDITWHPAAVAAGLPGTLDWSGHDDMVTAVPAQSAYAVTRLRLREQKLALRSRLYQGDQEHRRGQVLTLIAERVPDSAATKAPGAEGL